MSEINPTLDTLSSLIGESAFGAWSQICSIVKSHYNIDETWNSGGKNWDYEYKFRKGGKTLCTLYAKKDDAGLLIIFGLKEREKFEAVRKEFSVKIQELYDNATTYHDGKWVIFPLDLTINPMELEQLLLIKKKPNKRLLGGTPHYTLKDISAGAPSVDLLYSYKRKSTVENQIFRFTFEFDLTQEIKEPDLADMIIYCCQRDLRMQNLMKKYNYGEAAPLNDLLLIVNEYCGELLNNERSKC